MASTARLAAWAAVVGVAYTSSFAPGAAAAGPEGWQDVNGWFIAALAGKRETSGTGASTWGIWRVDPGPRGVRLPDYGALKANGNVAPDKWAFDPKDWWLEEHGLIMEAPDFPLPPGKYKVTGGREAATVLTIGPDGDSWSLADGVTLYDITHLGCRSARYTPAPGAATAGSPASVDADYFAPSEADYSGISPEKPMPTVDGCTKLDYAVLFVTALYTPAPAIATTTAAVATPGVGCDYSLAVYLGNGCFWHTQYDFYTVEIDAQGPFQRGMGEVTGRVGYAGGKGTGPAGQVCYHGGPEGTEYENMAYAEAVQVMLTWGKEEAQFDALAKKYFEDTFHEVDGKMIRGDPGDRGPPYRNVIGIPGGVKGPLYAALVKANVHGMDLVEGGKGGDPSRDTIDQHTVYVYCSILYPFYRGEQYHMFHPNVVLGRDVPDTYLHQASQAAKDRHWVDETCAETSVHTTNVEVIDAKCSAADVKTGQWLPGRATTAPARSDSTIFFSEVGEGSGYNKYLELYNAGDSAVDLAGYALAETRNEPKVKGHHDAWHPFYSPPACAPGQPNGQGAGAAGSLVVQPGEVFVVCNSGASALVLSKCNMTVRYHLSNGNDAFCLAKGVEAGFTLADCVGDFDGVQGKGWGVCGTPEATMDHTLVRKPSVHRGNADWKQSAGTSTGDCEWVVLVKDTHELLGVHRHVPPATQMQDGPDTPASRGQGKGKTPRPGGGNSGPGGGIVVGVVGVCVCVCVFVGVIARARMRSTRAATLRYDPLEMNDVEPGA